MSEKIGRRGLFGAVAGLMVGAPLATAVTVSRPKMLAYDFSVVGRGKVNAALASIQRRWEVHRMRLAVHKMDELERAAQALTRGILDHERRA